jgi:putative DNA primase/helicase
MSPSEYSIAHPDAIPQELNPPTCIDEMPYRGVWRRENNTKVPYNPRTGQRAKSNDPRTFGTRAQVDRALATGKYEGRCYLIHESLGVTAGDLDHVIPEADAFNEAALPPDVRRIIRIAHTYTTWSPSGTGIRFFFSAIDPTYKNTNKSSPSRKVCPAEAYRCLRFMTDTAIRIADTPDAFNDDPGDLDAWFEALGFEKREIDQPTPIRPASTYTTGTRTNADILELAFRAKNGDTIRRLYDGDISGYLESQSDPGFSSEADLALVSRLAFYVDDDEQLADLWRSSGLYRKKLDRNDYVQRTITKARSGQSGAYSPGHASQPSEPAPAGGSCDVLLATARAELAEARQTILVLRERVRLSDERESIQRNSKLGASRQTAAALASLFREERPKEPGTPTPFRMPLATLAERTGLTADTCSKQLKQLATYRTPDGSPVLFADTRDIPRSVDEGTGEITEPHREVWIGPGVDTTAFGYVLSQLAPADAPRHGGRPDRNTCPEHPDAGVLRRTKTTRKITRVCAHCHLVLDVAVIPVGRETAEHIPTVRPIQHHAFRHESDDPETAAPIRHHAFGHDGGAEPEPGPIQHLASSMRQTHVRTTLSSKMPDSPPLIDNAPSESTGPPPGWEDDRRRMYGALARGEAVS